MPFGRFAEQFVESRRLALNRCIQKIVNHAQLAMDPDLQLFLESDSFALDIKHRSRDSDRGGIMATIGNTITGPKFYETDEWFDKKKGYLDALESQLKGLAKAFEAVAKQRAETLPVIGELAEALSVLGSSDLSKQLSSSLTSLAELERKSKDVMEQHTKHDLETILGTVDEYLRMISSVRLAFTSRQKLFYAWKAAEAEMTRVRSTHEKTLRQRGMDRQSILPLQREIESADSKAHDARSEFEKSTKLIKAEVARFEHERVMEFKAALEAFLDGMIDQQNEVIEAWEGYQQVLLKRVGPATAQAN
ncbi:Vps5-domain-containing protein [Clavulina sp. PMI_390]|nr:Vps5-domain-containing protein [Clavulina sp. PMI_390]